MLKRKANVSLLSGLMDYTDSDLDDYSDEQVEQSPDSAIENKPPPRKKVAGAASKARSTTTVAAKGKTTNRRTSGRSTTAAKKTTTASRKTTSQRHRSALTEQENARSRAAAAEESDDSVLEEEDDIEESMVSVEQVESPIAQRPAAKKAKAKAEPTTSRKVAQVSSRPKTAPKQRVVETIEELEEDSALYEVAKPSVMSAPPVATRHVPSSAAKSQTSRSQSGKMRVEPQWEQLDEYMDEPDVVYERPVISQSARIRGSSASATQQTYARRRAGSVSDTERIVVGDVALRRRLGEVTKRLESLDMRYQDLRDNGIKDADANLDKLKKSSDRKIEAAEKLIESLKEQLLSQTELADESRLLKAQLKSRDDELREMQSKVAQLTASLEKVQSENSMLNTKITNLRAQPPPQTVVQNSAVKRDTTKMLTGTSAEATAALATAQLKEDLYNDLTGLIIRSAKRDDNVDMFDCLQTGRNGTLHFKLQVENTEKYEDGEFTYLPQLDESRDRALIEQLPEYLADDIDFERKMAGRFYQRVVDALTRKAEAPE